MVSSSHPICVQNLFRACVSTQSMCCMWSSAPEPLLLMLMLILQAAYGLLMTILQAACGLLMTILQAACGLLILAMASLVALGVLGALSESAQLQDVMATLRSNDKTINWEETISEIGTNDL